MRVEKRRIQSEFRSKANVSLKRFYFKRGGDLSAVKGGGGLGLYLAVPLMEGCGKPEGKLIAP